MNRLLLLNDTEAGFIEAAIETWRLNNASDSREQADRRRVDLFHISRRLEGKFTAAEREEIAQLALELLG